MQTERLKRLRACAGGCGVSTRIAASARSSQTRATLLVALAWARDMRQNKHNRRKGRDFKGDMPLYTTTGTARQELSLQLSPVRPIVFIGSRSNGLSLGDARARALLCCNHSQVGSSDGTPCCKRRKSSISSGRADEILDLRRLQHGVPS